MKKLLFILTLLFSFPVIAETLYVTDNLDIMVRSGKSSTHRIIGTLKSGKPVTILSKDAASGYSNVKYGNNRQGWVLTRLLSRSKAAKTRLASAEFALGKLQASHKITLAELQTLKGLKSDLNSQAADLQKQNSTATRELEKLKKTSANAVQTLQERDQLQQRVVTIERELGALKRENNVLKNNSAQDWFLVGAGVLFLGLLLGFLLPKISWRKKSSWSSSF